MKNNSIFWARLLGLYVVIVCVGMFKHISAYQALISDMTHNPSLIIILGVFTLLLGLAIVVSHSVWKGWPIIVTFLGYWITMKGFIFLYFPEWVNQFIVFWQNKNFYLAPIPGLAFGLVLLYCGFFIKRKGFI